MRISSVLVAAVFALGVAAQGQTGGRAATDENGSVVGVEAPSGTPVTQPDKNGEQSTKTILSASPESEATSTPSEGEADSDKEEDEDDGNITSSNPMTANNNADYDPTDHKGSEVNIGAIVGGVVGGLFGVALVGLLLWFGARRRKKQHNIQQRSRALINLDKAQPVTPSPTPGITDAPLPAVPTDRDSTGGGGAAGKQEVQQGPVELQSREVDPDGVSVRSFDLEEGRQGRNQGEVPRLPIYGGGNAAL